MAALFIGILPRDTNDADLHAFLVANGADFESAKVLVDRTTGKSFRMGVIYSEKPDQVIERCNGKALSGYVIAVEEKPEWQRS